MIAAQGLTKFYGDKCAVENLSFEIGQREIAGILGLNGAGKTTTLKILACLLLPSEGSVTIDGIDVVENPHRTRRMVGFLPDRPPLYDEMTVEAYLTFAGQLRGLSAARTATRLDAVAERTEINDVRDTLIGQLSHGYRQRVGIAQAIIHEPPLLILDEPIAGLDPAQIKEMRKLVRELAESHTILLSSHILSEISQTCDRVIVINDGRLVAAGTLDELAERKGRQETIVSARGERSKIEQLITGIEGVAACNIDEEQALPAGDVHRFRIQTKSDIREAVAKALIGADCGLLELRNAGDELESAFMQLTRPTSANQESA